MEFVQVRLLTNMSDPFPKKIVRERLTGSSAFYGERLRSFVGNEWKLRLAYIVCFAFTNEEYHIASIDFIYSSRGRIRKLRVALGLSFLLHQWGIPHRMCRFYLLLAGA